jgi:hypothetical protein
MVDKLGCVHVAVRRILRVDDTNGARHRAIHEVQTVRVSPKQAEGDELRMYNVEVEPVT